MLWCFGNFPVDFELVDLRRLSSFLQGRTGSEQDIRNWYTARLQNRLMSIRVCFQTFRVMSGLTLQWVMTRLSRDKNLWWSRFSARPKFEPSEDSVQVVLCSLRLLGSVVGTRFAVCFDRDHAFSLDLCYGRVWTWIGSSTFVKLIVIIQGLGSAIE
jgi:hypothetical protein